MSTASLLAYASACYFQRPHSSIPPTTVSLYALGSSLPARRLCTVLEYATSHQLYYILHSKASESVFSPGRQKQSRLYLFDVLLLCCLQLSTKQKRSSEIPRTPNTRIGDTVNQPLSPQYHQNTMLCNHPQRLLHLAPRKLFTSDWSAHTPQPHTLHLRLPVCLIPSSLTHRPSPFLAKEHQPPSPRGSPAFRPNISKSCENE